MAIPTSCRYSTAGQDWYRRRLVCRVLAERSWRLLVGPLRRICPRSSAPISLLSVPILILLSGSGDHCCTARPHCRGSNELQARLSDDGVWLFTVDAVPSPATRRGPYFFGSYKKAGVRKIDGF